MLGSEIKISAETRLRDALGEDRISNVDVNVASEDDGREFLDIVVHFAPGRGLPTAEEVLAANRQVRRQLALEGETRFPSILYLSADEAA